MGAEVCNRVRARLLPTAQAAAELLVERRQVGAETARGAERFAGPVVVARRACQPGQGDVGVGRPPALPGRLLALGDRALELSAGGQQPRQVEIAAAEVGGGGRLPEVAKGRLVVALVGGP